MKTSIDIAKAIVADLKGEGVERTPFAASHYRRTAIIDYSQAIKNAMRSTKEETERAFADAYLYAEKAIAAGISPERMEESLLLIRDYWIPKLLEKA